MNKIKQADKMYLGIRRRRLTNIAGSNEPPLEKIIKGMKYKRF